MTQDTDIEAIRQAVIKEVLQLLRDPQTYLVVPSGATVHLTQGWDGPWLDDGCKLATLIEDRLLKDPASLSPALAAEYVRRAAVAANLTTFVFPPASEDGVLQAMFWNALDDTVLFEGWEREDPVMPSGERVRDCVTFTIGFGVTPPGVESN
jgi:hypothetical protein